MPRNPNCSVCPLRCDRIVWGNGEKNSPTLFIIGEAPGADEHYQRTPFIGKSGRLLRTTLDEIQKQLEINVSMFVTNTVMCRPPGNRDPSPIEILACKGRLLSEIKEYKPEKILLLGRFPVETIFPHLGGKTPKISAVRGKVVEMDFNGSKIPTLATWHPAYVLRNPPQFKTFVDDIVSLINWKEDGRIDWSQPRNYKILTTNEEVQEFFSHLKETDKQISLDIETTHLNPFLGFILTNGFSDGERVWIIHDELMKENLSSFPADRNFVVHNSKFEWIWYKHHYKVELTKLDDTLLMYHMLDERAVDKSLKALGQTLLGVHDWETPVKPYIDQMYNCPDDIHHEYLSYDVDVTRTLYFYLKEKMVDDSVFDCYQTIVKPAIPFVSLLTQRGMRVDIPYLEELGEQLDLQVAGLKLELNDLGGEEFNPASPNQLKEILFSHSRLGLKDRNKGSTDERTITMLLEGPLSSNAELFLQKLLKFREVSKLNSTYVKKLQDSVEADGRVHPTYYLEGTETGRLSAKNPPVQTIPRADNVLGPLIRKAFLPDKGFLFGDPDYAQLEVRVAAHRSGDENLISYVNSGKDIHGETASIMFRTNEYSKEQRQLAKNGFFAVLYLIEPREFVYTFGMDFPGLTEKFVSDMIDNVRQRFPEVYLKSLEDQKFALDNGHISTIFGRKRRFPLITKENRKDILRRACNTPIQGSASDICLLAAIRCEEELTRDEYRTLTLIHDGIPCSIRDRKVGFEVCRILSEVTFETEVKFAVDMKMGEKWGVFNPGDSIKWDG